MKSIENRPSEVLLDNKEKLKPCVKGSGRVTFYFHVSLDKESISFWGGGYYSRFIMDRKYFFKPMDKKMQVDDKCIISVLRDIKFEMYDFRGGEESIKQIILFNDL